MREKEKFIIKKKKKEKALNCWLKNSCYEHCEVKSAQVKKVLL